LAKVDLKFNLLQERKDMAIIRRRELFTSQGSYILVSDKMGIALNTPEIPHHLQGVIYIYIPASDGYGTTFLGLPMSKGRAIEE